MAEQLVNVHDLVGRCPFATSQKLLAGKWSLLIMHELSEGPVRFRELERRLYPITQATLTRALRQLEDDGLVHREVYGTIPPKVEYSLTEVGAGFKTVLASLENWGNQYIWSKHIFIRNIPCLCIMSKIIEQWAHYRRSFFMSRLHLFTNIIM